MGRIHRLPPELINHIAAGEVVERPASIVKELVENAIDAGATRLDITLKQGGKSIRIADNGCGMDQDDLILAFQNHATSKVAQLDDLFALHTLGFRGEALASISAVAVVTCTTRQADTVVGLKATVSSDGQVTVQETGCAPGTIMDISNLFGRVPARLKFLKSDKTELAHCIEALQQLALSHPEIAFTVNDEQKIVLKTQGSGHLEQTIRDVFRLETDETLLPILFTDPDMGYELTGFISPPHIYRSSRKWMATFVNHRWVQCGIFNKAIEMALEGMITPGKYPIAVVHLALPPNEVDVNVHPAKKEIKYEKANTLFSFIRQGVVQSYRNNPHVSPAVTTHEPTAEPNAPSINTTIPTTREQPVISHTKPGISRTPYTAPRVPSTSSEQLHLSTTQPDKPSTPTFRVIGQFALTYILVEMTDGLWLVDQHIASERTHYERFYQQLESSPYASQQLLSPLTFEVSPVLAQLLETYEESLNQLGFKFMFNQQTTLCLSAIPQWFSPTFAYQAIQTMLSQLEERGDVSLSQQDVIATMACHTAVRAGDSLNPLQMERIIEQWLACQLPWTCPHGRPVYHQLPHKTIMSWFDRPSLPRGV